MTHDKNRQIGKSENMKFPFAPICKKAQIGESENMKFPFSPLCKKAQIGETMTWVVATSIIVLVLVIAIFVTSILGVVGAPKEYKGVGEKTDLIPVKSLTSYLLTKDLEGSGKNIFEELKEDENLNEFNGENGRLAFLIFNNFYLREYAKVWMGVDTKSFSVDAENFYFGSRSGELYGGSSTNYIDVAEMIFLDSNKFVELILREYA